MNNFYLGATIQAMYLQAALVSRGGLKMYITRDFYERATAMPFIRRRYSTHGIDR